MIQLTFDELRVLGVLIEKELTTPEQYPLTANAAVNGCNQKSNRDPVVSFDENRTVDALESLRARGLVVQTFSAGSRVPRYRHELPQKLPVNRYEMVILAELMLRGPQTIGEIRGRASRMHPLNTLEVVKEMLDQMMARPEPLVRQLPPAPGSRAERYMQLLCPDAHPLDAPAEAQGPAHPSNRSMGQRIDELERQTAALRQALRRLALGLGEPDPTEQPAEPSGSTGEEPVQ
jgi:uncharacterized protein